MTQNNYLCIEPDECRDNMLYPIGIQNFEKIIKGGFAYVDKTDLVYDLIHMGSIIF